jgi:hypothetical protein
VNSSFIESSLDCVDGIEALFTLSFKQVEGRTTKKHIIFDGPFLTFWAYWNVKKVPDVAFLTFLKP